jgi:hypothetical protein
MKNIPGDEADGNWDEDVGYWSSTLLSSLQLLSVHCISASYAPGLRFCPLLAFPGLRRFPLFCDVIVYVL